MSLIVGVLYTSFHLTFDYGLWCHYRFSPVIWVADVGIMELIWPLAHRRIDVDRMSIWNLSCLLGVGIRSGFHESHVSDLTSCTFLASSCRGYHVIAFLMYISLVILPSMSDRRWCVSHSYAQVSWFRIWYAHFTLMVMCFMSVTWLLCGNRLLECQLMLIEAPWYVMIVWICGFRLDHVRFESWHCQLVCYHECWAGWFSVVSATLLNVDRMSHVEI